MAKSILIIIHFGSNVGYAVSTLEHVFYEMAEELTGTMKNVHFAYKNLDKGPPRSLPGEFKNIIAFDTATTNRTEMHSISCYLKENDIDTVFGFDLPVYRPCYRTLRRAGVTSIISYWGAPMSSINKGIKLLLKRLDVARYRNGPDHYIFESEGMRSTATHGRGVPTNKTSVAYLGVDIDLYKPAESRYVYDTFNISPVRKVVFYSGHMQERKGVHVIVAAAADIINNQSRKDLHFLFTGNRPGESNRFDSLYKGTPAEEMITFGGYRDDLSRIEPGCFVGVIASTGWDSFTMSALEMQACGLPLIVSHLQGLQETVVEGKTGFLIPPGDPHALAHRLQYLADNPELHQQMAQAVRARIEKKFTLEAQRSRLVSIMKKFVL